MIKAFLFTSSLAYSLLELFPSFNSNVARTICAINIVNTGYSAPATIAEIEPNSNFSLCLFV